MKITELPYLENRSHSGKKNIISIVFLYHHITCKNKNLQNNVYNIFCNNDKKELQICRKNYSEQISQVNQIKLYKYNIVFQIFLTVTFFFHLKLIHLKINFCLQQFLYCN